MQPTLRVGAGDGERGGGGRKVFQGLPVTLSVLLPWLLALEVTRVLPCIDVLNALH